MEVDINVPLYNPGIEQLLNQCKNRSPLMKKLSIVVLNEVTDNFRYGGRPAWLPVARGGVPLTLTGHLRDSFREFNTADIAGAGTNVVYAGIHNKGGKTRPHVIRPKNKKALRFGGRFAKSVNHPGSKIDKREFLMITDYGWDEIHHHTDEHLTNQS
ncbi:phage virion morphogenesis protein [Wohlfahrtiimonas larvae]|uniref:Phage virion morphogenesis protein n=1 Tax=Wohlfahrtiimonas larvae TaxID=1157986 RepID=A0ABP9MVN9_9GAMM|nr:phage virion morphogenesis protein [Wohlfahrtiimonas larvae]